MKTKPIYYVLVRNNRHYQTRNQWSMSATCPHIRRFKSTNKRDMMRAEQIIEQVGGRLFPVE